MGMGNILLYHRQYIIYSIIFIFYFGLLCESALGLLQDVLGTKKRKEQWLAQAIPRCDENPAAQWNHPQIPYGQKAKVHKATLVQKQALDTLIEHAHRLPKQ